MHVTWNIPAIHLLVVSTNPIEKYARQIGSSPQGSGWKYKMFELPPPSSIPRAYTRSGRQQQQSKLWCVSLCTSKECTGMIIAKDRKNTEAERCFNSQGHPLFIEYMQIHFESFERACYKYFEDVLRHLLKPGSIVKSWNHFPNSVREQL